MKKLDVISNRKIFLIIPCIVIAAIILVSVVFGVEMDISFKGGTMVTYSYEGQLTPEQVAPEVQSQFGKAATVSDTVDALTGTYTMIVNIPKDVQASELNKLSDNLAKKFADNKIEVLESNSVEASVGAEFFAKCLVAIVFAAILMIIYVTFRFKNIGGFRAAVCCVAALVHDMIIVFGVFAVLRMPLNGNFVAAMLTILGYSINNTIVIYDRVRENKTLFGKRLNFAENVNLSVNQSLTRSIHTTITTSLALLVICIVAFMFNIESITTFALPLIVGMVAGFYSSIFVSCPLWALWNEKFPKK